jgi:hypothetical protein
MLIDMARTVGEEGEETAFRVLVGKPEGKRQLGRPGHRWEYNVKANLKVLYEIRWAGFIWLRIGGSGGPL